MQSFDIDISIVQNIKQNMVSVTIVDDMVYAEVFCAVCQNDKTTKHKAKGKRVFYKGGDGSKYWILSNFGQHLKNVHKLSRRSSTNISVDDGITQNENEFVVDMENEPRCSDENSVEATPNEETLAREHNFSIEYVDVVVIKEESEHNTNIPNLMFNQISA